MRRLARGFSSRTREITGGLLMLILLIAASYGLAAYSGIRPITTTGGRVNQGYLWGEETVVNGREVQHRGVDFSYPTGTDVYAIANGRVVDMREDLPNNERNSSWGNYVLLQHDTRHWESGDPGQLSYVYSMYLHLSQWSIPAYVFEGAVIRAGERIATVDDTGKGSGGSHLHLQVVIHPQANRTLEPFTLDSENRSRNPELWIEPYRYGGQNTARVIGRVSNSTGDPVQDLEICGMVKPYGGYLWSRSYSYPWANPDDILFENFGTADVAPATRHLYAYRYVSPGDSCGSTGLFRDLGNFTFAAGRTTYIGLYPVFVPRIRWSSNEPEYTYIIVHNNAATDAAQVTTTFFRYASGTAHSQQSHRIGPNATIAIAPGVNFTGQALVSSSADISVMVDTRRNFDRELTNYTGVLPDLGSAPPSSGWEEMGVTLYAPVVKRDYFSRRSSLTVINTGYLETSVNVKFYNESGQQRNAGTLNLKPHGRWEFSPWLGSGSSGGCHASGQLCSVVIRSNNNQPLAGIVREYHSYSPYDQVATYNMLSRGSTKIYFPVVKYKQYNMDTGLQIQNVSNKSTTITVKFYRGNNKSVFCRRSYPIPAFASRTVFDPACPGDPDPDPKKGFEGTAVVSSKGGAHLAGMANEVTCSGSGCPSVKKRKSYSSFLGGSRTAYGPLVYRNYNGWNSGIAIQNIGSSQTTATLYYYNKAGALVDNQKIKNIQPNGMRVAIPPASVTEGAVKIVAGQDLAAIVNIVNSRTGDSQAIYNASNR